MDEEEIQQDLQLPPEKEKRKKKKKAQEEERPKASFQDLEAGHRKFMAVMIGLFVLILVLMVVFNHYTDLDMSGGI